MRETADRSDFRFILELIPPASRVLDLGCGNGDLLVLLAEHRSIKGRGIELSESGVRECVSRGLSVRQGNLDEGLGDYPSAVFDYVILSQTLPYIDHPSRLLQEMLRVGRNAIVSFPNLGHWRSRLLLMLQGRLDGRPDDAGRWYEPPRTRPVSVADFKSLCVDLGIDIVDEILLGRPGRLRGGMARSLFARVGLYVLKEKAKSTTS